MIIIAGTREGAFKLRLGNTKRTGKDFMTWLFRVRAVADITWAPLFVIWSLGCGSRSRNPRLLIFETIVAYRRCSQLWRKSRDLERGVKINHSTSVDIQLDIRWQNTNLKFGADNLLAFTFATNFLVLWLNWRLFNWFYHSRFSTDLPIANTLTGARLFSEHWFSSFHEKSQ